MIYMTHEKHGVHIAYDADEVKKCEANGWKRMGAVDAAPAIERIEATQTADAALDAKLDKPKRKYVRKAA